MALFNKSNDMPIDQVKAMRSKGFDNNQIVQALQRNGYSSTRIFDALNQADLVTGAAMPSDSSFMGDQAPAPPGYDAPESMQNYGGGGGMGGGVSNEEVEELVESIIDEKWEELAKDINKIVEWRNDVESRISKMEQRFESLKDEFDKLHQAIIGKIGDYDKNILEVGAEVKAMEKVFSKVLPLFTENVNELNRITQDIKKKTA